MTTTETLDALRYPVGKFAPIPIGTAQDRARWIDEIARTPADRGRAGAGLTTRNSATPYGAADGPSRRR